MTRDLTEADLTKLRTIVTDLDRIITTPRDVVKALVKRVAEEHGCTFAEVMSECRHRGGQPSPDKPAHKDVVGARWAAMRAVRDQFGWSTIRIGKLFNRDNSSVAFALGLLKNKKRQPYIPTPKVFHEVSLVDDAREQLEAVNP
jgi:hypothetical protein